MIKKLQENFFEKRHFNAIWNVCHKLGVAYEAAVLIIQVSIFSNIPVLRLSIFELNYLVPL